MSSTAKQRSSIFDSYRNRYLLLGVILTLALGMVAWIGYEQVEKASDLHFQRITQRNHVSTILTNLGEGRNRLLGMLQNVVMEPSRKNLDKIPQVFQKLYSGIEDLQNEASINSSEKNLIVNELKRDLDELSTRSARLAEIRINHLLWFPATNELQNKLLPKFIDSLTLLQDIAVTFADSQSYDEQEVYKILQETRFAWVRMTAELRLLVANRFGVFTIDTEKGMKGRHENLVQYSVSLKSKLDALKVFAEQERLGIYGKEATIELEENYHNWMMAFESLFTKVKEEGWRKDLSFLKYALYPVLDRFQQRISSLQVELDIQSATDITDLAKIARSLTLTIAAITMAVVSLLWLSYFSFNRLVLRPIRETTYALRQQASGKFVSLKQVAALRETRELADAFHSMRSQVQERQQKLDYMAHHDELTRLPNRALFYQQLEKAIKIGKKNGQLVALFFLDLDRFKKINDTLGHGVGDELLRKVANRLETTLPECKLARFGGDEFAIIAEGINDKSYVVFLGEKILQIFNSPFKIKSNTLRVSTSIGIAMSPVDSDTVSDLLKAADTAMYVAKGQGRNRYWFFTEKMSRMVKEKLALENELHQAVLENQFEVYYQPVVTINKQQLVGFECLLRWNHPERGLLAPAYFIDMLDETGLIKKVTMWLLQQVTEMHERFADAGRFELRLSINLTARMLQDSGFSSRLLRQLMDKKPDPKRLVIEMTEDALAEYFYDANETLQALRTLGVKVAIDDFGTGQSSLDHLRSFQFDQLKIDKSYVQDVIDDVGDASLVKAIIQMGHSFGMEVVAEGVETVAQLEFLQAHNCELLQGYLISKPVPAAKALEMMVHHVEQQPLPLDVIV
ncbi:MAG: EAL domain-containing protein [Pseudomonadota bacterium]|nr:EAL domain-containing protein [Pseudomonadota bacterium]